MYDVAITLPDPWVVIDVADLSTERLAALPDDATAVRDLLKDTATQLAERQVGFIALRLLSTEGGPLPTGLMVLTLDESDATDLAEVGRRVEEELAEVQVRSLGGDEYVVGVSTSAEESSFVRGDFRLVRDGLLLAVWSTITVLENLATEHEILDIIVGNLQLTDAHETGSTPVVP